MGKPQYHKPKSTNALLPLTGSILGVIVGAPLTLNAYTVSYTNNGSSGPVNAGTPFNVGFQVTTTVQPTLQEVDETSYTFTATEVDFNGQQTNPDLYGLSFSPDGTNPDNQSTFGYQPTASTTLSGTFSAPGTYQIKTNVSATVADFAPPSQQTDTQESDVTINVGGGSPVPEPATVALSGMGAGMLGLYAWRRRRRVLA